MVAALREWVTSVVLVTLLLSVAQTLIPEGSIRKIAVFTGGLILLTALLQPVLGADLSRLDLDPEAYEQTVRERREELETAGKRDLSAIIAEKTSAYISDKADTLGIAVTAEVSVEPGENGVPVPSSVRLSGPTSGELADYMELELGIPRERQVWKDEGTT